MDSGELPKHKVAALGRVIIVAPTAPPPGGMALQAQVLRKHLEQEGIAAEIIPTNPKLPRLFAGLKVIRTAIQSATYLALLLQVMPRVAVVHILGASYFYFFARVVPAIIIGRLMGKRVVLNYRGGAGPEFFARYGWAAWPILRLAQAVTAPSAYLARFFVEHGIACQIVPNILELERFKFRSRNVLRPNLLISRNLEPMYNVEMALRAFAMVKRKFPDARLDIVGTGSQEHVLRAWSADRNIAGVVFHGAVSNDRMPEFLEKADVLLNPTNIDNFPMSLLEAFASGVPVISTDVGGIRDLLGNSEAAILVRANDHGQMADEICRLLSDPGTGRRMSENAGALAKQFSWPCVRRSLLRVYYPDQEFSEPAAAVAEGKI